MATSGTASSGVEVPAATIVPPIVSSLTPNRRAIRTVESTSARAPIHRPRTVSATIANWAVDAPSMPLIVLER
ncbi:hypothetical protein C469_15893 [Halorubrum lipolyticum DSM 21995]|uniref:Uncharacterized protein n=1 Tax=Halorubrum lipolyticum DSM 21995 TaxID=1227482 RepID=M0NJE3_9EURY|nr:hypothetical protein C469_15893 [Halorubrum lipolyticum DSM 21995]